MFTPSPRCTTLITAVAMVLGCTTETPPDGNHGSALYRTVAVAPTDASVHSLIDPARARFERLDDQTLKDIYRNCGREAVEHRLGSGEIALCSVVYDIVLKRHFSGDFHAFLAWSRTL